MQAQNPKLFQKLIYRGKLKLLTGLRVGASKDSGEIGAVDLPVVRRVDNGQPYIPGSSIKGKLRSLLRLRDGENYVQYSVGQHTSILDLFGGGGDGGHASRLIVRDAFLTIESAKWLKDSEATDMPFTEIKFENSINLVKGTAEHPRQVERIPAGVDFDVEFIINVIEDADATPHVVEATRKALETTFLESIQLLQHDYLGGMGSRGYGQVKIDLSKPEVISRESLMSRTASNS